jgi:DNA-binding response OmpR family regulator
MPDVRVLLVEPDGLVRRATARALRDHFAVTQVHDAVRAMELILDEPRFDVVVTRADAPLMQGLALIDRLRADRNSLARRCLVLTRDADDMRVRLRDSSLEVLEQPARISELVDAVQRTADRS